MREGYDAPPLNPIPGVVWLILLPIVAMELVVSAGTLGIAGGATGVGWRQEALQRFALSPEMLDQMIGTGRWTWDYLMRFISYGFVHGSFTHALLAAVFILAMGKFVAEIFSPWSVLAVFFIPLALGGVAYSLIPGVKMALFGAYPGAYGLIGAFTFIIWARLGAENANRARAFTLIAFLLGIQLIFGVIFGGSPDWVADLVGFAAGFGLSFLVGPGGPAHLLRAIRQR
ncbi:membrane associated rhomboid family serine protease [Defluviimonas denitrificans]|jgi:membrane associated rhomboid family serine protease|uniref:Membrane associated rhomboid family serine protease n=1 Tax=Albidovulum denitrificans TaxID=404881 RepID=A0A2S8S7T6_9RHOB|nr:rhomboid family intramembrane serine protease [Defluviimonas denitrificans]PQV56778.1 membrane associated rhomboid family serine protease [Defluviimonas denitrificans]